jgi:hypothetical protein
MQLTYANKIGKRRKSGYNLHSMNRHLNKEGKEYKSHVKRRVLVGREGK